MPSPNDTRPQSHGDENVVSTYPRAQAIADRELVECDPQMAREAGFRAPLAFSAKVEALITQVPASYAHESVEGRRRDVLEMAALAYRRSPGEDPVDFRVIVHQDTASRAELAHTHELFVQCGPGDDGTPVLTVLTAADL